MEIRELDLKEPSKLMDDYIHHFERLSSFFVYDYHSDVVYKERLTHLKERTYDRERLIQYLLHFNQKYHPHKKVIENIKRLNREESVVVVAGQQAGLFTGPAYTLHKCLSILTFAKRKESELGIPVIPVFWIAGEDHDFEEINHINVIDNGSIRKHKLKIPGAGLDSVSNLPLDHEQLIQWVKQAFQAFGETEYTEELLKDVISKVQKSDNLIDFFSLMIHDLFGAYGLVLLDSGDPEIRKIESAHFVKMIEKNPLIAKAVTEKLSALEDHGYTATLEQKVASANLFYHKNGERILLERDSDGAFVNHLKGVRLTKEELTEIAKRAPEKLSNNVVTRPLMQESLLPTLAFFGGPGEVAYWSGLKGAFETMGMLMPPVLPRIRITMVDSKTKKWLSQKGLTVDDALRGDWAKLAAEWLKDQHEWDVDGVYSDAKSSMEKAARPLYRLAAEVNPTFEAISIKNIKYINEQLDFMKKLIERDLKTKHEVELGKFDRVKLALAPLGHPQERTWCAYHFLNYWGLSLVSRLMENGQYSFHGTPLLVEI